MGYLRWDGEIQGPGPRTSAPGELKGASVIESIRVRLRGPLKLPNVIRSHKRDKAVRDCRNLIRFGPQTSRDTDEAGTQRLNPSVFILETPDIGDELLHDVQLKLQGALTSTMKGQFPRPPALFHPYFTQQLKAVQSPSQSHPTSFSSVCLHPHPY